MISISSLFEIWSDTAIMMKPGDMPLKKELQTTSIHLHGSEKKHKKKKPVFELSPGLFINAIKQRKQRYVENANMSEKSRNSPSEKTTLSNINSNISNEEIPRLARMKQKNNLNISIRNNTPLNISPR